tara:strand:+ start:908 stop:1087 length:180 start_codon:yes stop_codon:yes gene_type:complete
MKKYKNHTIYVWDCTFYLMDEDGNEVLNDDGTIKIFEAPNNDWSYTAESIEVEDLEEKI